MKKFFCILLVCILAFAMIGCGGTPAKEGTQGQETKQENKEASKPSSDTVKIAFVAMSTTSPQPLVNEKYSIFADELAKIGKKVVFEPTRSLDNLYPMLDQEEGSPSFVYLPHSAFTTYMTETSKFGGSDKYVVIGGSMDLNDIDLVTKPEIKSIKDLAGKKVGISNLRYSDEFQLNQLLSTAGLSTKTMGGNVEVVWDDIVSTTAENYGKGLYDAIVVFNSDNRENAISKVPGSNVFNLHPEGLYGGKHPRIWLAAKKEILQQEPDLVKAVLTAHVLSTDKANADTDELAAINREVYIGWFKDKGADIADKNPLEKFQKRWKLAGITYDPNLLYINDLFSYLEKMEVVKDKNISYFVQPDPLNEVLKEMGKPELKQ